MWLFFCLFWNHLATSIFLMNKFPRLFNCQFESFGPKKKVYFFWEKNKRTFLLIICIGWFFQSPQTVIIIFLKQETHFIYIEKKSRKKGFSVQSLVHPVEWTLNKLGTKVLFTNRLRWQKFCPSLLHLMNNCVESICKTQKTRTKVLPSATVGE